VGQADFAALFRGIMVFNDADDRRRDDDDEEDDMIIRDDVM
jgi:hypothetical protein